MQSRTVNPQGWVKRATLFLISQNISLFGSSVVAYAIIWHITLKTSSGVWMMLSTLSAIVPEVLVSLLGGALADRVFEPLMASGNAPARLLAPLVGTGRGSGMAAMFLCTALLGSACSLRFLRSPALRALAEQVRRNT